MRPLVLLFRILLLTCMIFCSSCDKSIDPKGVEAEIPNHAEAGGDQISYVGSYTILDASKSNVNGETIDFVEWKNDPKNPEQLPLFNFHKLTEPTMVEFCKEGIYKFILQIECKSGTVYQDSMQVTVKQRQNSVIKDTCLEINIREQLKYKEGALTIDNLQLLDSLQASGIPGRNITSLNGMEYCTNLVYLHLGYQGLTDLRPIANLNKLQDLDLIHNLTIVDISPLSNLTNLRSLVIYGNPIQNISALSNMTKLTYLDASYTNVNDLSTLSRLVNLEELHLDGNGRGIAITDLEPLRNMTKLKFLSLVGRGISDITPLNNLSELTYLNLFLNNVKDITPISQLKKLDELIIAHNKLDNLSGLRNFENLFNFDANNNEIKDISELQYIKKIHVIVLAFNKIEDLSPIVNNPSIAQGVDLSVTGNPLNQKSINEYIPALEKREVYISK
ncbi:MAG: hypothetical protein Q8940_21550 [Bacteroidota bacterium]|nr:hypothetical protein [Bacteroidota bacterium]